MKALNINLPKWGILQNRKHGRLGRTLVKKVRCSDKSAGYKVSFIVPVFCGPGDNIGRSSIARRRAVGKRVAPVQTQGPVRGHHQGSEAALLLPETRREATRETSSCAQTGQKEDPQGPRLSSRSRLAGWQAVALQTRAGCRKSCRT